MKKNDMNDAARRVGDDAAARDAADGAARGFDGLGLAPEVLMATRDLGYTAPTPVQAQAIPQVLSGRDVMAAAQTGTGKTAAFLLPALSLLPRIAPTGRGRKAQRRRGPQMLVITPTRELAQQIDDVATKIARRTHHVAVTVVGGVAYGPQKNALARGCDVLVATPGRLVDLIDQGAANLDEVRLLVLDEADRMLDMGFVHDVRKIVSKTPSERQTLLFSATLEDAAVGAIADLVRDPARVEIAPEVRAADTVEQYVLPVSLEAKNALLAQVLKAEGARRVIVFTRTKHRADACCRRLARAGIRALPIHGNRTQNQRERALEAFRRGDADVLVATDVLARGIDITDVRYVVNFDVPSEPTDYIHRIGRTGRAGEEGWSLTFVTEQDVEDFYGIEALMGKVVATYDAARHSLELGENPPAVDPARVPARTRAAGKKKTKHGKSTSKKNRAPRRRDLGADDLSRVSAAAPAAREEASRPQAADGADHGNWARHDARVARERAAAAERTHARRETGRREAPAGQNRRGAHGARRRDDARTAPVRAQAASGKRTGSSRQGSRAHDWRNSDLVEERPRRGGARSATKPVARKAPATRTRRPGDRGGRR